MGVVRKGEEGREGEGGLGRVQAFLIQSEPGHRSVRVMPKTESISEFPFELAVHWHEIVGADEKMQPNFDCMLSVIYFTQQHVWIIQNMVTIIA